MSLPLSQMITLIVVTIPVSILSVSIGGTSLVVVPLLVWFGIDPRSAIATSKFAILFLSLASTLVFRRSAVLPDRRETLWFAIPVILGSAIGARLVAYASSDIVRLLIGFITIGISLTLLLWRQTSYHVKQRVHPARKVLASFSFLLISVYGGFFSGGYATLLTYSSVMLLGLPFIKAVASTRLMSVFSAGIATLILARHGLVSYSVGIPLAFAEVIGAYIGVKLIITRGEAWLRRLFLLAAIALALRILIVELFEVLM